MQGSEIAEFKYGNWQIRQTGRIYTKRELQLNGMYIGLSIWIFKQFYGFSQLNKTIGQFDGRKK